MLKESSKKVLVILNFFDILNITKATSLYYKVIKHRRAKWYQLKFSYYP